MNSIRGLLGDEVWKGFYEQFSCGAIWELRSPILEFLKIELHSLLNIQLREEL